MLLEMPKFMESKFYNPKTGKLDPKAPKTLKDEFREYNKKIADSEKRYENAEPSKRLRRKGQ